MPDAAGFLLCCSSHRGVAGSGLATSGLALVREKVFPSYMAGPGAVLWLDIRVP